MTLNKHGIPRLDSEQQLKQQRRRKGEVAELRQREDEQRTRFRRANNPNNTSHSSNEQKGTKAHG